MGLDMYLTKRVYIGAEYDHRKVEGVIQITENGKPVDINFKRVSSIEEKVGYWRKANQIHNWFVNNVQNGVDDCGEYEVTEEQLLWLLSECKKVKENSRLAEAVLPTKPGFFFGGVEYDEYYMEDIDQTISIIETIFNERGENKYCNGDFYYRSSW